MNRWAKLLGGVFCCFGIVSLFLAAVAAVTQQPLDATVFPPYGLRIVRPDQVGALGGWVLDTAISALLGVSGLAVGGFLWWAGSRSGPAAAAEESGSDEG